MEHPPRQHASRDHPVCCWPSEACLEVIKTHFHTFLQLKFVCFRTVLLRAYSLLLTKHRVAGFLVSLCRGCEGCLFVNFSVVLFPGEQCRDGIVLRCEAFSLDVLLPFVVSRLAYGVYVCDTSTVKAIVVTGLCGLLNTHKA